MINRLRVNKPMDNILLLHDRFVNDQKQLLAAAVVMNASNFYINCYNMSLFDYYYKTLYNDLIQQSYREGKV
jgi:hypothetical protein